MDKRLLRNITALSLPAIITNITTPLLALTDTAIAGHMGGAVFIAAIAVGGTMFNMLYWLCGFLRMGSSGLTAQALGAGDMRGTHIILTRALALAALTGLLMIALRRPIAEGLLTIIDTDSATHGQAIQYFMICIWGAPATLGMFALTGWCIGMQNSRLPMWTSLLIDVLNIALSLTLVLALRLKIEGIAIGTLTAQWAGFIVCLTLSIRCYGWQWICLKELIKGIGRFFRINTDIFLRTLCLVAVTMWFTRTGAIQGALMLAVNALLMQLFTLFSFFMDGLAFAGEALCGRYLGAGDTDRLRKSTHAILSIGGVLAIIFTLLYIAGGQQLIAWLCDDHEVVVAAGEYFAWAVSIPLVAFAAFMWDGIFIGITRTRAMLASMASATAVYFACYFITFSSMGNHGLWIAFLAYLFTRGVVLTMLGRKYL